MRSHTAHKTLSQTDCSFNKLATASLIYCRTVKVFLASLSSRLFLMHMINLLGLASRCQLFSVRTCCRIADGATTHMHDQLDQINFPLTEPTPDDSPPPDIDLARIGPLRVVLEEVVDEGGEAGLLAAVLQVIPDRELGPPDSGLPTPIRWVGYISNSRCMLFSSISQQQLTKTYIIICGAYSSHHTKQYIHVLVYMFNNTVH